MKLIVFTASDCGRAALAAALFNALVHPAQACAVAAVDDPSAAVSQELASALAETNRDSLLLRPSRLTDVLGSWADTVVIVGKVKPPVRLSSETKILHWTVPEPATATADEARAIRDALITKIRQLLTSREWLRGPP